MTSPLRGAWRQMKTLEEKIEERHAEAGYICEYPGCNKRSEQIAHKINKGKTGRKAVKNLWFELFGEEIKTVKQMDSIIHHRHNTRATCIKHNSYVLVNISNRIGMIEILKMIRGEMIK